MKSLLILISLLSIGCTTVYKVDSNGVCRAPDGKVVKEAKIDPDRYIYNGPCYVRQPYDSCGVVNGGSELGQKRNSLWLVILCLTPPPKAYGI